MYTKSKWSGGRPVAVLFAATIVLPSVALGLLAWRALDSDRRLAEQAWRDRLQDSARRSHAYLERCAMELRNRADALARGQELPASLSDGTFAAILTPKVELSPAAAFAWLPDGPAPENAAMPAELAAAEAREQRATTPSAAAAEYQALLKSAPDPWRGWVYLRLSQTLLRGGDAAGGAAALRKAATLPDSPGPVPSRFAARFELSSSSPEEAANLYRDLNRGVWLMDRSSYSFYESRLREWAGHRIPPQIVESERRRQGLSRLLQRVVNGESGWLEEPPVTAFVATSYRARAAVVITLESQWQAWLAEIARELPGDVQAHAGAAPPASAHVAALSLTNVGLPWSVWAEPRDATAPFYEGQMRRRLLLAILCFVVGVLVFGSFVTVRIVRRDLRIARLQSDFTATVSHEFRTPLTGIRQLAEMLLAGRGADDEAKRRKYYELMCRESDRLTRLVENVLDLSRIEEGRKEYRFVRIETAEWLHGLAGIAEQRRSITANLPEALPPVHGDREALSSAVLNLLDNAIKYSPDGSPVALRASGDGDWVTIAVEDQGCGIPTADQPRIFDRFYRGSAGGGAAKGVGLGLALVKRIADAHGARVGFVSAPGGGSTFYLSLRATS